MVITQPATEFWRFYWLKNRDKYAVKPSIEIYFA